MLSFKIDNKIDGYSHIMSIDVASLQVWWKAIILVFSNLAAIPAIIVGFKLGQYLFSSAIFVSMLISMAYHLCQTTEYCLFGMTLDDWQKTDHTSAGTLLAFVIILFYIYRPKIHVHYKIKDYHYLNDITIDNHYNNHHHHNNDNKKQHHLGPRPHLDYDDNLNKSDKKKICFKCRGINPQMLYDWQSVVLVYFYIFLIIVTINAIPLTTQSFLIIINFGVIIALLKILVIEEGDPKYLNHRFHRSSLITGIVLVVISLIFYFIDGYLDYWLFHSLWHLFSYIGFLFIILGTSYDIDGWFSFVDILKFLWNKTKCCKFKKKSSSKKHDYYYSSSDSDDKYHHLNKQTYIIRDKGKKNFSEI